MGNSLAVFLLEEQLPLVFDLIDCFCLSVHPFSKNSWVVLIVLFQVFSEPPYRPCWVDSSSLG